jgi:menaquinone-9 beta-reductase
MPDSCAVLAKLGIDLQSQNSRPFRSVRFVSGNLSVQAPFPGHPGIGVRRTVLHRLLIEKAEAAGVCLLWQTPVTGTGSESIMAGGQTVRSRWIVGADGGHSRVRHWAGLEDYRCNRNRFAFRRHYRIASCDDVMEIHWGPKCQLYLTPLSEGEICVAAVSSDPKLRLDAAVQKFPEVAMRLKHAEPTSQEKGAISSTRKLRRVQKGNIALVGDASGAVDCITGEGLCLSFRQAEILAECFADGSLRGYEKKHRSLSMRPAMMARLMLALDWSIPLRRRVMRAFESDPRLFRHMLAMHVGALSPMEFAANGFSLGFRMLIA